MSNFGKELSKFKLYICLKSGEKVTRYSLQNEEKKSDAVAIGGMVRRLLFNKFKGKYQTALIYNRQTDQLVAKYVNGVKEF